MKPWTLNIRQAILLFLIFILQECGINSRSDKEIKVEIIGKINKNVNLITELSRFIENQIDTNFYGQYRIKSNEFFFFYWKEGRINGSFTTNDFIERTIQKKTSLFDIEDIWKREKENFYRYGIVSHGERIGQILGLRQFENEFAFSVDSKEYNTTIITDIDSIKYFAKSFIFRVNKSTLIYFPDVYDN